MYNTELFNKTIPAFGSWAREAEGFTVTLKSPTSFYGYRNDDVSPIDGQERHISDSELSEIHTLLPIGLRILANDDPLISKNDIGELLDVWSCVALVQSEKTPQELAPLVAFTEVDKVDVGDYGVRIYGAGLAVVRKSLSDDHEPLLIPVGHQANVFLTRMWMDHTSPGWESRYQIANDLGLDAVYLVNNMFQNEIKYVAEVTPDDLVM